MGSFDPFFAYELIDAEMAKDLYEDIKKHRNAVDSFIGDETPEPEKAREVVQSVERVEDTHSSIMNAIYRVPAVVHVAGERKEESNPDNPEETAILQRCSRCGSIIQFWYEGMMVMKDSGYPEEVDEEGFEWREVGAQIAKQDARMHIGLYEIEDRPLERWETECADLSGLEGLLDEQ